MGWGRRKGQWWGFAYKYGSDSEFEDYLSKAKITPQDPYYTVTKKKGMFHGKHIYTTSLSTAKVFDEDQYKPTLNRLIADKVMNNKDITSLILGFADVGDAQFNRYYLAGKYDFKDRLPSVSMITSSIPKDIIKNIIEKELNIPIKLHNVSYGILSNVDWCRYQMQKQYNYDIADDILFYQNKYYYYDTETYNSSTDNITVNFHTLLEINKISYRYTVVSKELKDDITDIKVTTISTETTYSRGDSDVTLYKEVTTDSVTKVEVPKGSVLESENIDFINDEVLTIPSETISFIFKAPHSKDNTDEFYLAQYSKNNSNQVYFWIYDPSTNKYSELTSATQESPGYEVYPIATIKEWFNEIAGKDKKNTDNLLRSIGLSSDALLDALRKNADYGKVKDAYFMFGVSPADKDPIVASVLYSMTEYIYNKFPAKAGTPYSIVTTERNFQNRIMWTGSPYIEKKEKIIETGSCKHSTKYVAHYRKHTVYGEIINNEIIIIIETTIETSDGTVLEHHISKEKYGDINRYTPPSFGSSSNERHVFVGRDDVGKKATVNNLHYATYNCRENEYREDGHTQIEIICDDAFASFEILNDGKRHYGGSVKELMEVVESISITKQINKTTTRTYILDNFKAINSTPTEKGIAVIGLNGENKELVIPLSVEAVRKLTIIERTKLLDNAVYLTIYAFDHQHVKWYATGAFQIVLKVIMVAIVVIVTVVTLGQGTTPTLKATALLMALLKKVAIAIGLSLTLKVIYKHISNPFLKILAAVGATVIATYAGGEFSDFGFIDAVSLVSSSVNAFNYYTGEKMPDLQSDVYAFSTKAEKKTKEYQGIIDSFNTGLDTQDIAKITITNEPSKPMGRDTLEFLALDAYKDFDLLYLPDYTYSYVDNQLTLTLP